MLLSLYQARLDALRAQLARDGLDGFVVPISDEHMSEYVGAYAQRLGWLTGFGGSAGSAVVLTRPGDATGKGAAIFTDGRYTVQVREQVPGEIYDYEAVPASSPLRWLAEHAPAGGRIGYDPLLHTAGWVAALEAAMAPRGAVAVAVERNPIDAVWEDRPAPSDAPAVPHPERYAGRSSADKRASIADGLRAGGADAAVIAALDSVAWLFNMRGADIANSPLALSFALQHADGTADLFLKAEKVTPELAQHLGNAVRLHAPEQLLPILQGMGGKRVLVDPERTVAAVSQALAAGGATIVRGLDPTILPKAVKNAAEQEGHRAAQARDGAAVARFLRWLSLEAPGGGVDELAAAAKLRAFREESGSLRDISFDTISAAGAHAALPHYKVDAASNIPIPPSSIFLVDSGGQYLDGTTDITRTVWVGPGEPDPEQRRRNTLVLKGHIALAVAVFAQGTTGGQLDALARQFLWADGLDYAHGTGHGVGSYLCVHEGPQRIAKPGGGQAGTGQELLAGMILSNEPGYYKPGHYGIRIENLILVERAEIPGAEGEFLRFETLTLAPLDRRLIEPGLLTPAERAWVDAYHARVLEVIGPQLAGEDRSWLEAECAPLPA